MTRRELLAAAAGMTLMDRWAWAEDLPRDIRITRIVGFKLKVVERVSDGIRTRDPKDHNLVL